MTSFGLRNICVIGVLAVFMACGGGGSTTGGNKDLGIGTDLPDTGGIDVPKPDIVKPDVPREDVPLIETTSDVPVECPGNPGCPCETNAECFTSFCIDTMDGKQCAQICGSEVPCPNGFSCEVVQTAPDVVYACISVSSNLCRPCKEDAECATDADGKNYCIDRGLDGSFCGLACESDDACPNGFVCSDVTVGRDQVKQCVPEGEGECPCTDRFKEQAYKTFCYTENTNGKCKGERTCDSECDAAVPAAEVCDGKDEDCSGVADDNIVSVECKMKPNSYGACQGMTKCIAAQEICEGQEAGPEICNGIDDNCNGTIDDEFPNLDKDEFADCVDCDIDGDTISNVNPGCPAPTVLDNCSAIANTDQADVDGDLIGDACDCDIDGDGLPNIGPGCPVPQPADNCPNVANADQKDADGDLIGDACDCDADGDSIANNAAGCPVVEPADNCVLVPNVDQKDLNANGTGDACDCDVDSDGVANNNPACPTIDKPDNCITVPNADQIDTDVDLKGDACDCDKDGDEIGNANPDCVTPEKPDNCETVANLDQGDVDVDGTGDACDCDVDADGVMNNNPGCPVADPADNCKFTPNPDQEKTTDSPFGDACNADWDGDNVLNGDDNCAWIPNADQANVDSDDQGDACDCDIDNDGIYNANPECETPEVPDNCIFVENSFQEDMDADTIGDVCDDDIDGDADPNVTDCQPTDPMIFTGQHEVCNGLDDDCDGAVDTLDPNALLGGFFLADQPKCENQNGVCVDSIKPAKLCVEGAWLPCAADEYAGHSTFFNDATEKLCDGKDNDCDGAFDEDFVLTLRNGTQVTGVGQECGAGVCFGGATQCKEDLSGTFCTTEANAVNEMCNNIDDDCDGLVDAEDLNSIEKNFLKFDTPACENQVGVCFGVKKTADLCVGGDWSECTSDTYAQQTALFQDQMEQKCDGLDNDCDGEADEDFLMTTADGATITGANKACGAGKCAGGNTKCMDDQTGIFCPGEANIADEICNNKDDDCDGLTDAADVNSIENGFLTADKPLCEKQQGVCESARKTAALCEMGAWKPCVIADYELHDSAYEATSEVTCDGLDNDCDGTPDEDFVLTQLNGALVQGIGKTCGTGECKLGVTECSFDQTGIRCPTEVNASYEVCNGLDDDCDGYIDSGDLNDLVEGYLRYDAPHCEKQDGLCAASSKPATLCEAGKWKTCSTAVYTVHNPAYEADVEISCDGMDNDCNREVDEDFKLTLLNGVQVTGINVACGVGVCANGMTQCKTDKTGIQCPSEALAAQEKCDALDNDCDGNADDKDTDDVVNGFLRFDSPTCTKQQGVCANSKKPVNLCVNGAWTDCQDATYLAQNALYDGATEIRCDAKDNDCNGEIDEDFEITLLNGVNVSGINKTCGVGVCAGGKTACTPDGYDIYCPFEAKASDEKCNAKDDDCDGQTDGNDLTDVVDGFLQFDQPPCENSNGLCEGTKKPATLCQTGTWKQCDAATYKAQRPAYEATKELTCDGLDNDCSGKADEDFSVVLKNGVTMTEVGLICGVGACANGQITCTNDKSGIFCSTETKATQEKCNNVDDDCDGLTDGQDTNDIVNSYFRYDMPQCDRVLGVCADSKRPAVLCVGGVWQACQTSHYQANNPAYEGAKELSCDGLDNDCNGETDEDFSMIGLDGTSYTGINKKCGAGQCNRGDSVTVCNGTQLGIKCLGEDFKTNEKCDNVDNDCDGYTDGADANDTLTGYFLYDQPLCENQDGACSGQKKRASLCNVAWKPCTAADYSYNNPTYSANAETKCDNIDNDCDKSIDEDFTLTLLNGVMVVGTGKSCGVGVCTGGTTLCKPDQLGILCNMESNATVDTCDNKDNDCDGNTDENFPTKGLACDGADPDVCMNGTYTCTATGAGVECVNETGTTAEVCDGKDNDCDGSVDEIYPTLGQPCDGSDTDSCKNGVFVCGSTTTVVCGPENPTNIAETCNGKDDDCDGSTDETFPTKGAACDGSDADKCTNGTYTCMSNGSGVECINENPANVTEKCNGGDDDCDGSTDETFPTLGLACDGSDSDSCAKGTYTCKSDGTGVECVNETSTNITEKCNGIDDDCDGLVDEDWPTKGQICDGNDSDSCKNGTFTCMATGVGLECSNETVTNITEKCNAKDDDCDGLTDETFTTLGAVCDGPDSDKCKNGVNVCLADGSGVTCGVESPANIVELCNGIDDDCDGQFDEDFTNKGQACDGSDSDQCKNGTFTCKADGSATECTNENPTNINEKCNGSDDDCDGLTDETFPLKGTACDGTDSDQCKNGTFTCKSDGSALECVNESTLNIKELCDAVDNDCDGATDEDTAAAMCGNNPANSTAVKCVSGHCDVTCNNGFVDEDDLFANGCECGIEPTEYPNTCSAALDLGTITAGAEKTQSGQILSNEGTAADQDWFKFTVADSTDTGTMASHGHDTFIVNTWITAPTDKTLRLTLYRSGCPSSTNEALNRVACDAAPSTCADPVNCTSSFAAMRARFLTNQTVLATTTVAGMGEKECVTEATGTPTAGRLASGSPGSPITNVAPSGANNPATIWNCCRDAAECGNGGTATACCAGVTYIGTLPTGVVNCVAADKNVRYCRNDAVSPAGTYYVKLFRYEGNASSCTQNNYTFKMNLEANPGWTFP